MKKTTAKQKSTEAYDWFVNKYTKRGYRSLSHFAEETGMQKSSLSRYFHLQRQIPSNTIGKLCATLNVKPTELLTVIGALD